MVVSKYGMDFLAESFTRSWCCSCSSGALSFRFFSRSGFIQTTSPRCTVGMVRVIKNGDPRFVFVTEFDKNPSRRIE
jgi:hypothetical protein